MYFFTPSLGSIYSTQFNLIIIVSTVNKNQLLRKMECTTNAKFNKDPSLVLTQV